MFLLGQTISPTFAAEGINEKINFQGKVTNSNGTNVSNASYDFVFRLYKASSGGVAQWTETWNSGTSQVAVVDGVFQVALGTHQSLSSLDFNDDAWYLSVQFNGDNEMDPRIRLTSVPFAFNAKTVAGLTVQDAAGNADTTGTLKVADGKTLTFVDDFTTAGAFSLTLTTTASTNVTLPTTGTLATLAGTEEFTNKTIGSTGLVFSGAPTDINAAAGEALVINGNAASTIQTSAGSITLQPAGASTTSTVQIGAGGVGSETPDFFGLDVKSNTGDPVSGGFEGAMYYNTADNKFRCYQGTGWTDCIGTGTGTPGGNDTYIQYNNGGSFGGIAELTYNDGTGELSFIDDIGMTFSATENLEIASDLAGTVNVVNLAGTPSATAGTAYGLYIDQIDSSEANGFDASLVIDNSDITGATIGDGILFVSAGAGFTDFIDTPSSVFKVDGSGNITGVGATFTGTLNVNGDAITADGALTIKSTGGDVTFQPDNDTDDYLYISSTGTVAGLFFYGTGAGTDPGIYTSGTELGYIDETDSWVSFDSLAAGSSPFQSVTGLITKITANDQIQFTMAQAGDYGLLVDSSIAPTVDLVQITNSGYGTTTNTVDGLDVNFTAATGGSGETNAGAHITITDSGDAGDTISGLQITAGTASTASSNQYGINIEGITGGSGTEYALVIGTGWDRGLSVASASTFTSTLTSEGAVTIGSSGNTFTFDPASGPVYAGTARITRKITLIPEYEGAVFTPDGTNNSGTMTSDFCYDGAAGGSEIPDRNTAVCNSGERHNYYYWTSNGANDYDIWVDWQVPDDFHAFATNPAIKFYARKDAAGDAITVTLFDDLKTICGSATSLSATSTWTNTNYADVSSCDGESSGSIIAGDIVTFRIQMSAAANGNDTYMGEIEINYLAKF